MPKGIAKSKEERRVLYRAVRIPLYPNEEQERLLINISDWLQNVYNEALEQRMNAWKEWHKQKQEGITKPGIKLPTLFDQINALTQLRAKDEEQGLACAQTPRNWQEETLDALDSAFKSFFALAKRGDRDARPPRMRDAKYFNEIPGRSGFSMKDGFIHFAPNIFGRGTLAFPIPAYCEEKLLSAVKLTKFTLFRDEARLDKHGRWWVSVAYTIEKPESLTFEENSAIYLALGATWIGVLSYDRTDIIKLWRPDKYWKPKIDELETKMKACAKGSRKWSRYHATWLKFQRLMANQQKQNQREEIAKLLKRGVHFVVQDMTIRGGLADGSKPERGGALGLNWSVQNTGSIARFVAWLDEKAKEHGGYVLGHKPTLPPEPGRGAANKIMMARRLKTSFIIGQEADAAHGVAQT